MVMMGSQTFFLYFLKKLVKYLLVSENLYIFAISTKSKDYEFKKLD